MSRARTEGVLFHEAGTRPAAALVPYERNARTHAPGQVAQLAASMREFGLVRDDGATLPEVAGAA